MTDNNNEVRQAVIKQFEAGKSHKDLYEAFPEIAQGTIRSWVKRHEKKQRAAECTPDAQKRAHPERAGLKLVPPPSMGKTIEFDFRDQDESDLLFIRGRLKALANNEKIPPSVQVQASLGLLKMIELRTMGRVKENIVTDHQEEDLSKLTDEELKVRYQQFLAYDGSTP